MLLRQAPVWSPVEADRRLDIGEAAADGMHHAVDDHLGRVDLPVAALGRISALALGEGVAGEGVAPAEIVPVVDRQAERDDVPALRQLAQNLVGRRTARATLAGEQLDNGGVSGIACEPMWIPMPISTSPAIRPAPRLVTSSLLLAHSTLRRAQYA